MTADTDPVQRPVANSYQPDLRVWLPSPQVTGRFEGSVGHGVVAGLDVDGDDPSEVVRLQQRTEIALVNLIATTRDFLRRTTWA